MGRVADKLNIDFVVSTGDNFYDDGLTGVHDPAFQYSFSDIYTANSLQKQWYNGQCVTSLLLILILPCHSLFQ